VARELRHEIEARQGGGELLAQARAHLPLDELRAGKQPQPDAQRAVVVGAGDEFAVEGRQEGCSKPK
jgi:hypothetical protein